MDINNNLRLLLISSSTVFGSGYLDSAEAEILSILKNASRVLFIPFALKNRDAYAATAKARYALMGKDLESIHEHRDPQRAVADAEAMFVGGGNTFRLLKNLYDLNLVEAIRKRAVDGMPYIGSSAGTNIAGLTIRTTNDMPIVEPPSFKALGLVPFQLNPHYLDADPNSKHMGETREQRLIEYLEENDVPVVGLREGAMLSIAEGKISLKGTAGARIFKRGETPFEVSPGVEINGLLD